MRTRRDWNIYYTFAVVFGVGNLVIWLSPYNAWQQIGFWYALVCTSVCKRLGDCLAKKRLRNSSGGGH